MERPGCSESAGASLGQPRKHRQGVREEDTWKTWAQSSLRRALTSSLPMLSRPNVDTNLLILILQVQRRIALRRWAAGATDSAAYDIIDSYDVLEPYGISYTRPQCLTNKCVCTGGGGKPAHACHRPDSSIFFTRLQMNWPTRSRYSLVDFTDEPLP